MLGCLGRVQAPLLHAFSSSFSALLSPHDGRTVEAHPGRVLHKMGENLVTGKGTLSLANHAANFLTLLVSACQRLVVLVYLRGVDVGENYTPFQVHLLVARLVGAHLVARKVDELARAFQEGRAFFWCL